MLIHTKFFTFFIGEKVNLLRGVLKGIPEIEIGKSFKKGDIVKQSNTEHRWFFRVKKDVTITSSGKIPGLGGHEADPYYESLGRGFRFLTTK